MECEIKAVCSDAQIVKIPSVGGVFDVVVDDRLIYTKSETNRFPYDNEVIELMK